MTKLYLFQLVHKWSPCHRELLFRSHVDKTIVLLKIGERYVPIVEAAMKYVEAEDVTDQPVDEDRAGKDEGQQQEDDERDPEDKDSAF